MENSHSGTQILTHFGPVVLSCRGQEVPPRALGWNPGLGICLESWAGIWLESWLEWSCRVYPVTGAGTLAELGNDFSKSANPSCWGSQGGGGGGFIQQGKRFASLGRALLCLTAGKSLWHLWIWCHGLRNYSGFLILPLFNYLILSMYFKLLPL